MVVVYDQMVEIAASTQVRWNGAIEGIVVHVPALKFRVNSIIEPIFMYHLLRKLLNIIFEYDDYI